MSYNESRKLAKHSMSKPAIKGFGHTCLGQRSVVDPADLQAFAGWRD
jgi:hypothetical protein